MQTAAEDLGFALLVGAVSGAGVLNLLAFLGTDGPVDPAAVVVLGAVGAAIGGSAAYAVHKLRT